MVIVWRKSGKQGSHRGAPPTKTELGAGAGPVPDRRKKRIEVRVMPANPD